MKNCRKCKNKFPLDCYYKHVGMADGHLNICKDCTKKRIHFYWEDGRGKVVDKKRGSKEERKEWQKENSKKMRQKYAKKYKCRAIFWNKFKTGSIKKMPCSICNTEELVEAHHPDYNKPFLVQWLCSKHHKEWHRKNETLNNF